MVREGENLQVALLGYGLGFVECGGSFAEETVGEGPGV